MFYSICYDIKDDRRRNEIAKALKNFGDRVQMSVFELNIDEASLERLKKKIASLINQQEDNLRIYPICASCLKRIQILGEGKIAQDPDVIIL